MNNMNFKNVKWFACCFKSGRFGYASKIDI